MDVIWHDDPFSKAKVLEMMGESLPVKSGYFPEFAALDFSIRNFPEKGAFW